MNVRRQQFRSAAHDHLTEACHLLNANGGRLLGACYLSHVALECALKARLLAQARAPDVECLRRLQPALASRLFDGAAGHDLSELARAASLPRFFAAAQTRSPLGTPAWRRLATPDRAYGLRYGVAPRLARTPAREEVTTATGIIQRLLRSEHS